MKHWEAEKTFNFIEKTFGRTKRVITFAAPKEGKQLRSRKIFKERESVTTTINRSALRNNEVLIFYGKFFDILKHTKKIKK